jgi:hypothetical protein
MVSFLCAHLYLPPYAPHALPISFVSFTVEIYYDARSYKRQAIKNDATLIRNNITWPTAVSMAETVTIIATLLAYSSESRHSSEILLFSGLSKNHFPHTNLNKQNPKSDLG